MIKVADGKVRYDFLFNNSFHVRTIEIEAIPKPRLTSAGLIVDLKARCTRFDLEECPGEIDRLVAHLLNKGLGKTGGTIASINVTKAASTPIVLETNPKMNIKADVKEVVTFLDGQLLKVQANVVFTK